MTGYLAQWISHGNSSDVRSEHSVVLKTLEVLSYTIEEELNYNNRNIFYGILSHLNGTILFFFPLGQQIYYYIF